VQTKTSCANANILCEATRVKMSSTKAQCCGKCGLNFVRVTLCACHLFSTQVLQREQTIWKWTKNQTASTTLKRYAHYPLC